MLKVINKLADYKSLNFAVYAIFNYGLVLLKFQLI